MIIPDFWLREREKCIISFLRTGCFSFVKHESPAPNDVLCQVWVKLAQWVWRRRLLNFVNVFLPFHFYLPLERGLALPLKKLKFQSPKIAFCHLSAVWWKYGRWFWRRRWKCEMFTTTTTKNGEISVRTFIWTLDLCELKKRIKYCVNLAIVIKI